jgi:hypothetical protein
MVSCSSAHVVRLFSDFCKAYELLCSANEAASCVFFLDVASRLLARSEEKV